MDGWEGQAGRCWGKGVGAGLGFICWRNMQEADVADTE